MDAKNNDTSNIYSILFDLDGHIIDASPSAANILGYDKEELLSMNMPQIDPLFSKTVHAQFSKIQDPLAAEALTWETIHQNKKGAFFPVSSTLRYIKNQTGTCGLATLERLYPAPATSGEDASCTLVANINGEGMLTQVSTKLASLLGRASTEMLGSPISHFHPAGQKEALQQTLLKNLAVKEPFKLLPHPMLRKDNTTVNLESYFAPHTNDQGQFTGFNILSWQLL